MSKMVPKIVSLSLITLTLLMNPGVAEMTDGNNSPELTTPGASLPPFGNTNTGSVPGPDPISLSVINKAGYFLLPVSVIFIIVNGFLVGIICKNWEQIKDSVYYNSTLLCLFLTSSDLALCLFLGLPIGVRFTFERQLREVKSLEFYTETMGFLLFEYLYILRVIIVAVMSVDRCLHIFVPFKYMFFFTKTRIKVACGVIVALPFVKLIPVIHVLCSTSTQKANVHCTYYYDEDSSGSPHYQIPLTCMMELDNIQLSGFRLADMVVDCTLIGVSWLIILVSNICILVVICDQAVARHFSQQHRVKMNLTLTKNCIAVFLVASSFVVTNFPFAYAWSVNALSHKLNYKQHFNCILLSFLSLFFHPWFYCFKMRNIRKLISGFKRRVQSANSNLLLSGSARGSATICSRNKFVNSRVHATMMSNLSPANSPRLLMVRSKCQRSLNT